MRHVPGRNRRPPAAVVAALAALTIVAAGVLVGHTVSAFSSTSENSGNRFATASSFAGCPAVTPVWMSGFETGRATSAGYTTGVSTGTFGNVSGGGSFAIDSTVKRSGTYSAKVTSVSGSAGGGAFYPPASSVLVARFAIRFASLPAADVSELFFAYGSTATGLQLGYRAGTQKLFIRHKLSLSTFGPMAEALTPVTAGTWYVIDFKFDDSANPHTGQWRIDGVAQPGSSAAMAPSDIFYVTIGSENTSNVFTAHYDDVLMSRTASDYPIGDGRILSLAPDSVRLPASPELTDDDNTAVDSTSFTRLDEVPLSAVTDAVKQGAPGTASFAEFGFEDTSAACIRAVTAASSQAAQLSTATNHGKTAVHDGGTESVVWDGNMAFNTSTAYLRTARVAPAGGKWTATAVNGLAARVGYSSDVTPAPRWDALRLEFDSRP